MPRHAFLRFVTAGAALLVITGCDGGTTSPVVDDTPKSLLSRSPSHLFALPGETVSPAPAVKLVGASQTGIANARVTFSREGPDGDRTAYVVVTNAEGIAQLGSWRLGATSGQYRMIATADNARDVVFTAFARGRVAASYDLALVSEKPIAATDPVGHYILYDDGSFISYYEGRETRPSTPTGWYEPDGPGTLSFYLAPQGSNPYAQQNFLFASGEVRGNQMTVYYQNWSGYDRETYIRRD